MTHKIAGSKIPCPKCKTVHTVGKHVRRTDIKETRTRYCHETDKVVEYVPDAVHCPPDVNCECGLRLRFAVPVLGPNRWDIVNEGTTQ